MAEKHRLVTRSDFDGLVCAVLLKELDLIDEIRFVHPKDAQDGTADVQPGDICTNLPYNAGCYLVFDHHESETFRLNGPRPANHIIDPSAPSASRVVFNHFGGRAAFPRVSMAMLDAVDKCDSAQFTRDEILQADGWVLLNYLMDARTGLGRFKSFRISNYQLMMELIDACRELPIEEVLELPDVKERVDLYRDHADKFLSQLKRCSQVHDAVIVVDLREEETIFAGNRFMVYALNPQCTTSVHVMWGLGRQNTVFAIGKSILNRASDVNIGELCLRYGGGGHANAGTCQVANERAEVVRIELLDQLHGQMAPAGVA